MQQQLHADTDARAACDLTMTERVRICGSRSDDDLISWCERYGVAFYPRRVRGPHGAGAMIGVRVYGGDVARALGGWHWSDRPARLINLGGKGCTAA